MPDKDSVSMIHENAKEAADRISTEIMESIHGKKVVLCGSGCDSACTDTNHHRDCWLQKRRSLRDTLIGDLFIAPVILDDIIDGRNHHVTETEIRFCKDHADAIVLFTGNGPGINREFEVFRQQRELLKKLLVFVPADFYPYIKPASVGPFAEALNHFKMRQGGLTFAYNPMDMYAALRKTLLDFFILPTG
ncbi:MAG: hypothetical protein HYU56_01245 [Candidatus Aenigmarchaeota archaeon]|nr:hypothetical protein [Candidatus Aenigmarchaeota archaeon]